jgi:N-acetylglutamate synthase-like GNAT family acetyltransferase
MNNLIIEEQKDDYLYSTDKAKLDVTYIHNFLSSQSYWAKGIPKQIVQEGIDNALCFGVYSNNKQVGFARVITDFATFGYLADVFIDPSHRGKGLSKNLVTLIVGLKELQHLRRFALFTRDAHGLYSQFGFKPLADPSSFMNIHRPDVYEHMKNTL